MLPNDDRQTKLEPFKIVRLIGDSQFLFATFVSLLLYNCQIREYTVLSEKRRDGDENVICG